MENPTFFWNGSHWMDSDEDLHCDTSVSHRSYDLNVEVLWQQKSSLRNVKIDGQKLK
jgi:hypothetical protein